MKSDVASIVDRVLLCGLDLKDRLDKGEKPDIAVEQAQLRELLRSDSEARRWPDYGGDSQIGATVMGGQRPQGFAGGRYALACWLDEIFIADPRWGEDWRPLALELEMYGEVVRYDRFWEQARRAEARANPDALEMYFLCTMLGFRGNKAGAPEQLRAWCDAVEARITSGYDRGYDQPSAKVPPCNVPPLAGRDKLRKLMLYGAILVGIFLLLAVFALVSIGKSS